MCKSCNRMLKAGYQSTGKKENTNTNSDPEN